MEKIAVFSGNRADFGILFPLIYSLNGCYQTEVVLSGAHVLKNWDTGKYVCRQMNDNGIACGVTQIPLKEGGDVYKKCMGEVYIGTIDYFETNSDTQAAIVLGDRIEAAAFALGAFYSKIPLIHICGGDVVDAFNFDNSIRHSISKLANYHFVTNERSRNVVIQIGEEEERVYNIGNLSYDYERLGCLTSMEEMNRTFGIDYDDTVIVYTYHPECEKTEEENYWNFKHGMEAVIDSAAEKIIVTYPNNDLGHELILDYVKFLKDDKRVMCVASLGTYNYMSLMKNYKAIIVGNSSSGLLETPLYCVPVLNVGGRQNGRVRGCNVTDVPPDYVKIKNALDNIINNYSELKAKYVGTKYIFGDGKAAIKAVNHINEIMKLTKEERLLKKFVER